VQHERQERLGIDQQLGAIAGKRLERRLGLLRDDDAICLPAVDRRRYDLAVVLGLAQQRLRVEEERGGDRRSPAWVSTSPVCGSSSFLTASPPSCVPSEKPSDMTSPFGLRLSVRCAMTSPPPLTRSQVVLR